MTLTLGKKKCREGVNDCMNYEFTLLHHVGVVAKRVRAAAETAAEHEGDDNTPSGSTGRGLKTRYEISRFGQKILLGHKELFFILWKAYNQICPMTLKPIFSILIF